MVIYVDSSRRRATVHAAAAATAATTSKAATDDVLPVVPNVIGSPALVAADTIRRAGFAPSFAQPISRADLERAIVRKQSPAPMRPAARGTRVALSVEIDSMTTVPNVVGMSGAQAEPQIKDAMLVARGRRIPHATVPAGLVIEQDPGGGTRVPRNSTVTVTYSTGAPPVSVPNLANRTREEAERLIADSSLRVGTVNTVTSPSGFGRVVWQDPPAGTITRRGAVVQFHIGRRDPNEPVTVPLLIGRTLDSARALLRPSRLALHLVDSIPDSARTGTIVRQEPRQGVDVQRGSEVHVWTARPLPPPPPDSANVPDVRGLTSDSAAVLLRNAGFVLGEVLAARDGTPGLVSAQDPAANARDTAGAVVSLWIGPVAPIATVDSVRVPVVTQLLLDSALRVLRPVPLSGRPNQDDAAREPGHWVVTDQRPAAGVFVTRGSTVLLYVRHLPDSVTVPDVTARLRDDAQTVIRDGGLTFRVGERPFRIHFKPTVVRQAPDAGDRVLRGTDVTVALSQPLGWPLTLATLPLLGFAGKKLWPKPRPDTPKIPTTFAVRGTEMQTPPPSLELEGEKLITLEITLDFGVDRVDSLVEGTSGPITLDAEDPHA